MLARLWINDYSLCQSQSYTLTYAMNIDYNYI